MKDRPLEEKPACSVQSAPFPMEVACPACNTEVEMWSDETDITCKDCGCMIQNSANL